jgi:3-oxoadipate enol-lactonase
MATVRTDDGIEIPFEVQGDGDGPKLVFAHGLSGQSEQTRAGLAPLVDAGWTVASFDQRGHANATPVTDPAVYDPVAMGNDLWAVAGAAGFERCWIGGGSMGGATSFRAAMAQPDRVEGLVAGCPALHDKPHEMIWLFDVLADSLRDTGMDGLVKLQREFAIEMGAAEADLARIEELRAHNAASLECAYRSVSRWVMPDFPSALAGVPFPVIVIGWDNDQVHPLSTAKAAAAAAGVELIQLEFAEIVSDRALLGRILAQKLPAYV